MRRTRRKRPTRPVVDADVRAMLRYVAREVMRARAKFPPFHSAHEGYAVLLEEVDELWNEIKQKQPDPLRQRCEAMQVAAMAVRFLIDLNT